MTNHAVRKVVEPAGTCVGLAERVSTKARPVPGGSWVSGRAYSGRAELRYANLVLCLLNLALLGALLYSNVLWYRHAATLGEQQWVVFHDAGGQTTARTAGEFRSGPSDEEIRGRAWDLVRWYLEAGTSNYGTAFAEARAMMTPQMQQEFDQAAHARAAELQQLNIYRRLEEGHVRPLERGELPAGMRVEPSRYDVVVTGRLDTYRSDGQGGAAGDGRISTGPVSVYVRVIPQAHRTQQNPTGLLVGAMIMLPPRGGEKGGRK